MSGRFDTVNYKGVEQKYERYSDEQWRDFQNNSDGETEDDFFGGGWEQKGVEDRKSQAMDKAKKEYERRQSIENRLSSNAAASQANADRMGALEKGIGEAKAKAKDSQPIEMSETAKKAQEQYEYKGYQGLDHKEYGNQLRSEAAAKRDSESSGAKDYSSGLEAYSLNYGGDKSPDLKGDGTVNLSYNPNAGKASQNSGDYMEGFKDNIMSKNKAAGVPTRGYSSSTLVNF